MKSKVAVYQRQKIHEVEGEFKLFVLHHPQSPFIKENLCQKEKLKSKRAKHVS